MRNDQERINQYKDHPLYETCKRAHYATSHSPERRGADQCASYDAQIEEFKTLIGDDKARFEDVTTKFKVKFLAHMAAKSRCMSSMITGPANFPVRRAEKANESEHKRSEEVLLFIQRVKKNIDKERNPHKHGISSDDDNALELLETKVAKLKKNQEQMKAFNKIVRDKKENKVERIKEATGWSEEIVNKAMEPSCFNTVGFETFQLTNNLANIKRLEGRIVEITKRKASTPKDVTINGVRVLENVEDMRLQLFFDGKPEDDIRAALKSHGFRWSPTNEAWQRKLTNNAIYSFNQFILPVIKPVGV